MGEVLNSPTAAGRWPLSWWRVGGRGKGQMQACDVQGCAKALGTLIQRSSRDRPVSHTGWWPLPRGTALAAPSRRPRRRRRGRPLIDPISRYIRPRLYLRGPSPRQCAFSHARGGVGRLPAAARMPSACLEGQGPLTHPCSAQGVSPSLSPPQETSKGSATLPCPPD